MNIMLPIAWSHIIFTAKYSFKRSANNINISKILDEIENIYFDS